MATQTTLDAAGAARPPAPSRRRHTWVERAAGVVVLALVAWLGLWSWGVYDSQLRPLARTVPTWTPTAFVDAETAREQGRRLRLITDHVGAGNGYRAAGRPDLAAQEYLQALAIDPDNSDARQNLREMGIQAPPGVRGPTPTPASPTPAPTVTVRP